MEILKKQGYGFMVLLALRKNRYTLDCKSSIALVMGGEGEGMRRLTRERCDDLFALPMLGSVESLNVSVATGVCL